MVLSLVHTFIILRQASDSKSVSVHAWLHRTDLFLLIFPNESYLEVGWGVGGGQGPYDIIVQ